MLGEFQIIEELGSGGMGQVWRASHVPSSYDVAIKVIHSSFASKEVEKRRFRREVEAMATLNHRGIVGVVDVGEVERSSQFDVGAPWFAMEIARGGGFDASCIKSFPDLCRLLFDVLDALAYAHARGIVHRDMKPDNILLDGTVESGWRPVLTDFGLAHIVDPEVDNVASEIAGAAGTPAYMAPEQFHGAWRSFGPWTDLYALGCMAWELACDRPPFTADTLIALAVKHTTKPLPPLVPRFPVPRTFEAWLRRCTEKDPIRRFRTAADASWTLFGTLEGLEEWAPSRALCGPGEIDAGGVGKLETLTMNLETVRLPRQVLGEKLAFDKPDNGAIEVIRPPIPGYAFESGEAGHRVMRGVGLNLFGLRQIPFVDRNHERSTLWKALRMACSGTFSPVLVRGESGVGKTRLVRWLSTRALEVGAARVMWVRHAEANSALHGINRALRTALGVSQLEGTDLFESILETLESWASLSDEAVPGLRSRANELAQLFVPDVPEGELKVMFESPQEGYRLITWLLELMCRERPLILVFDDVQYGGDSLGLLSHLVEYARLPMLAIACVGDTSRRPVEEEFIAELTTRDVQCLDVQELRLAEREAFVRALIPLDEPSVHRIVRATGGRPSEAIQAVADLISRHALVPGDDGFVLDDSNFTGEISSVSARSTMRLIKETGSRDIGLAMEIGAAFGNQCITDEWRAVLAAMDLSIPDDALDVATRVGLVEQFEDGWAFRLHDYAEAMRENARLSGRWRPIHLAASQIDLSDPQAGVSRHERYAFHLSEAGLEREALDRLMLAIEEHMAQSRYRQVRVLAREVDQRLARLGVPKDDAARIDMLTYQIDSTRYQGRFDEARNEMYAGEARVVSCPDARARANAFRAFGNLTYLSGDLKGGQRWIDRAFSVVPDDDHLLQAKLHHGIGWFYSNSPHLELAMQHFERAVHHAELANATAEHAWSLQGSADVLFRLGDPSGEAMAWTSRDLFVEVGSRTGWATATSVCGDYARQGGRIEEAMTLYEDALRVLDQVGSIIAAMVQGRLAVLLLLMGEHDEALAQARKSRTLLERAMSLPLRVITELVLAALEPDADVASLRLAEAQQLLKTSRYVHPDVELLLAALEIEAD